jgi:hypothetical protein
MHRAILKAVIFLIVSVVGSPSSASEPMPIGPVPVQIPVKGIIISTVGAGAIQIETHADRSDLALHLSVPLNDLERQGAALAQALGLNIDGCHGLPLNVHVTRAELQPAAPNLVLVLHGTVRGWLCKPIKTVLTPELDVTGKTTLAVRVGADHSISVEPSHTALDVKGLDSLGAAGGIVRNLVSVLEKRFEAGLSGEMTKHALLLDRLVAPAAISGVTAAFAGKSIEISLTGSLSATNATILATKLINGSISK